LGRHAAPIGREKTDEGLKTQMAALSASSANSAIARPIPVNTF
jgi:hypothetical protein